MPYFVLVGKRWINLGNVLDIGFQPDPKTGQDCAVIRYQSADGVDVLDPVETAKLVEVLKSVVAG